MSISRQDLKAILVFAIHLSKVDSDFSLQEKKMLKRYADTIGLQEEERAELVGLGGSLDQDADALSSNEAKELLLKTLCAVSFVDGNTTDDEVDFIQKVQLKLGIDYPLPVKADWGGFEEEVFTTLEEVCT
ncbi:MAG: hypothetical protein O7B79_01405 [SAR324 cluster bacterium]|nr:hypothetical protein [SAR324 cluster bacterium]MCZ6730617.1 hypothetical protein [SAR324 cluster bacterium]